MMELPQCHGNVAKATWIQWWSPPNAMEMSLKQPNIATDTACLPVDEFSDLTIRGLVASAPTLGSKHIGTKNEKKSGFVAKKHKKFSPESCCKFMQCNFWPYKFQGPDIASYLFHGCHEWRKRRCQWRSVSNECHPYIYYNEQPTACRKRLLWFMKCGRQHSFVEPNSHQPPHFPLATRRATNHEIYADATLSWTCFFSWNEISKYLRFS